MLRIAVAINRNKDTKKVCKIHNGVNIVKTQVEYVLAKGFCMRLKARLAS